MTVASTSNRVSYDGTGALTPLAVAFPFFAASDLVIIETIIATGVQSTLVNVTHYTVTGTLDTQGHYSSGGTVTPVVSFATTVRWTIYRDPPRTQQEIDLVENDSLPAESVEAAFDYLTMLSQRNADLVTRSLRQPDGDSATIDVLPSAVGRASMYLGFDTDGDPVALAAPTSTTGVSAFMATMLDDADAAAARATLGITVTSNKDNEFVVTGSGDTTKKLAFEVDGLTTATTRTVTAQDLNGTMALIPTVAAYTGTATLGAGVGLARLSGATFTLTLPPIATATNRPVTIRHQGTSLTQVYTIKGNVADNIIAADGTANTYLLYTTGEEVTLIPDGTSWYEIHHWAKTDWVDAGVMTITGSGASPAKPSTPDLDKVYWRRDGNQVFLRYILQISSATGGTTGTGGYLFALPTNITLDTTIVVPVGSSMLTSIMSEAVKSSLNGAATFAVDSVSVDGAQLYAVSTSTFQAVVNSTFSVVGSSHYSLDTAEMSFYMEFSARAANWRL